MEKSFLLLACFLFLTCLSYSQVSQVEPPHWYVGMKEPKLQLMVYGKDIGQYKVTTNFKGFKINGTHTTDNSNYLFINVLLNKNCKPGTVELVFWKDQNPIDTVLYTLLPRDPGSATREGFNTSDVIYLVTPDRFANGDEFNDEIEGMPDKLNRKDPLGRHGGDLQGIFNHMDYFDTLGITALWLNPVLENNMPKHSYHGYAITDFYKVDPRMGSNDDYRQLSLSLKDRGIKMIMDMVVNHCGLQHHWMTDPPDKNWINYYQQPYVQTNHRKYISIDPYVADEDKRELTEGWFVRTMPDLNTKHPLLATYLIQNTIWWIEYAHLAGIRMDTYLYPDENFMSDWAKAVLIEYPRLNISGEVWHDDPSIVSYWQDGKINPNKYDSNLPSLFDFPVQSALRNALTSDETWRTGWIQLYDVLSLDALYPDPANLVVFADNHDMSRIFSQVENRYDDFRMAMAYVLTSRGIPQIYYGTEVLLSNAGNDDNQHGVIRADFPGGWKDDISSFFTPEGRGKAQNQAFTFLKNLIHWRNQNPVIHHGNTLHYVPKEGVYVLFRYDDHKRVMVILNKNEGTVRLYLDRFATMINTGETGTDIISGRKIVMDKSIVLEGRGPQIIELSGAKR